MAGLQETTMSTVYDDLGVCTVINAAGTLTRLGGSRMPPEVHAAMAAASHSFVRIEDLQLAAGRVIAAATGAEARLRHRRGGGGAAAGHGGVRGPAGPRGDGPPAGHTRPEERSGCAARTPQQLRPRGTHRGRPAGGGRRPGPSYAAADRAVGACRRDHPPHRVRAVAGDGSTRRAAAGHRRADRP